VTVSYDGGAETTIDNVTIPAAQAGEFTKDYDLTTRNTAGIEKYSFTVTNRDGLDHYESNYDHGTVDSW
jgi:hypothetical protein